MNEGQNGRRMDQSNGPWAGSIAKVRARTAGISPSETEKPSMIPRRVPGGSGNGGRKSPPQAGLQSKSGAIGLAISKPTPLSKRPSDGPFSSPVSPEGVSSYRPPPGRAEPPKRPPRPKEDMSILDASEIQEPTPVFLQTPSARNTARSSDLMTGPSTPMSGSSRYSELSSVGSIPDFPLPTINPSIRKSIASGPPPSARRGGVSFYSATSYVSPIPEESPGSRSQGSHGSFASSAAIPDSFGTISPQTSSPDGVFFDDNISEPVSNFSDDTEERDLVRSASLGRKGKPSIVTMSSSERGEVVPFVMPISRPTTEQLSNNSPLRDEIELSSRGSQRLSTVGTAITTDTMTGLEAGNRRNSVLDKITPSPRPARFSLLRRPPKLDINAVRDAEARGSLTSLPDLIKRATRLATFLERGRRPGSRLGELDMFSGGVSKKRNVTEKDNQFFLESEQPTPRLSDMLNAFPPPATRNSMRQSVNSWPLPSLLGPEWQEIDSPVNGRGTGSNSDSNQNKKRRCCGLPLSGAILLGVIILAIVVAAIVIPVELLVVRKNKTESNTPTAAASSSLEACRAQVNCANGGTNIITQGICSCICSNGFTGSICQTASADGCTTTSLAAVDNSLTNVTLGNAIPNLILNATTNFSLNLTASTILSKFNAADLSCQSQNALVTFNSQSAGKRIVGGVTISFPGAKEPSLTTPSYTSSAMVVPTSYWTTYSGSPSLVQTTITITKTTDPTTVTATPTTITTIFPSSVTSPTTPSSSSSATASATTFKATEQSRNFARTAILFVLQEQTLKRAILAQSNLQNFFSLASTTQGATIEAARNVSMGGSNSIDLTTFRVSLG